MTSRRSQALKQLAILRFAQHDNLCAAVTDNLFVGSIGAARNLDHLDEQGITHIVSVVDEPPTYQDHFEYLNFVDVKDKPTQDITQVFPRAFEFIDHALGGGGKVLVHCMQGKSRSVAVVAAYLMRSQGMSFHEALAAVRTVRPVAEPNLGFVASIKAWDRHRTGATQTADMQEG